MRSGNNALRRDGRQRSAAGRSAAGKDGAASPGPSAPAPRGCRPGRPARRERGEPGRGAGGPCQNLPRSSVPAARGRAAPRPLPALLLSARGAARFTAAPPPPSPLRICLARGPTRGCGRPRRLPRGWPGAAAPRRGAPRGSTRRGRSLGAGAGSKPAPPGACPARGGETRGPRQGLFSPLPAGGAGPAAASGRLAAPRCLRGGERGR